jgi:hypothetical protein
MRTFFSLIAAGVVGLGVSLAVVGCGSPTNAPNKSNDKMGGMMDGDKMGDKMSNDKMGGNMASDKISGGKSDKMDDTKK